MKSRFRDYLLTSDQNKDDSNILTTFARIILYGSMLAILLYLHSSRFSGAELILTVLFVTLSLFIELMWKRIQTGRVLAHLFVVCLIIAFSTVLTYKAMEVRSWWFRTHVIEKIQEELITNSANPIVVFNGVGKVVDVNQKSLDLLQYSREEITNLYIFDLVPKIFRREYKEYFEENVNTLEKYNAKWVYNEPKELIVVKKNGEQFTARCVVFASNLSPLDVKPNLSVDIQFYVIGVENKELNK